ncbi:hypothetical protein K8M07_02505 [Schnuerera sp. xch1]|uniref:hypothetical protein n=1 Tax=Schnuerera sp. xch1 TaxID=2874283 RepID=UPI001CBB368D|nr:hypothetical protein [Schnuerera sp. xch1]MBZ2174111.1 hypothetical protein [Schnuerera sp. xch1]
MNEENNIKKVVEGFKDFEPGKEQIDKIEELADKYSNKSEDDIFIEIIKANEKIESEMEPEEYEAIFEKLEAIRPMLNEEQQDKLDKILQALGRD